MLEPHCLSCCHTAGFSPPTRDWPEYEANSPTSLTIFDGGYQNGFYDASWNTQITSTGSVLGLLGKPAICAVISPNVSVPGRDG